ncbi:unnamed protein product [Spirodela intermedia]|uniref:COBRA-like protein n=1 Tax=Spirodela intermedia TaxID=51605 RepID=A0A7I8IJ39_SPIIN|nr:unnamed protein product [Spirodela intermedia]CAA6657349.1 unnamed protein product [Spirodela intermedia]
METSDRGAQITTELRLVLLLLPLRFLPGGAYDPLDPNDDNTIRWDVMSWAPDGYVAMVTMNNFQMYRHIMSPGWTMGWTWAKEEVIWFVIGAQATEQGDCSKFKANIPHCCQKTPAIVDLLPGVPYNQQIQNCCKGGVLSVGQAGTTNRTVRPPKNFTLMAPGPGYICSPAQIVPSTTFLTPDGRRKTQALNKLLPNHVTCTWSQFLASKNPTCCVSFSSFYNTTITPCLAYDSKLLSAVGPDTTSKGGGPSLQCTHHMCPVGVHWHIKLKYKEYWRVKIAITNFSHRMNYSQWTLVAQHPNIDNVAEVFSFGYKPLVPYQSINDTGMFFGIKYFNDLLMEAGPLGNVHRGGRSPGVYFNGAECTLPPSEAYPSLPNAAHGTMPGLSFESIAAASALWALLLTAVCKCSSDQRSLLSFFSTLPANMYITSGKNAESATRIHKLSKILCSNAKDKCRS